MLNKLNKSEILVGVFCMILFFIIIMKLSLKPSWENYFFYSNIFIFIFYFLHKILYSLLNKIKFTKNDFCLVLGDILFIEFFLVVAYLLKERDLLSFFVVFSILKIILHKEFQGIDKKFYSIILSLDFIYFLLILFVVEKTNHLYFGISLGVFNYTMLMMIIFILLGILLKTLIYKKIGIKMYNAFYLREILIFIGVFMYMAFTITLCAC